MADTINVVITEETITINVAITEETITIEMTAGVSWNQMAGKPTATVQNSFMISGVTPFAWLVKTLEEVKNILGVASVTDELVKYDATDAAAGYLSTKVVGGTGITLAEGTGGNVDKLVITSTAVGTDEKVKYDAGDSIAGYFSDKIIAGSGIIIIEGTGLMENKSVIINEYEDEIEFATIKSYMI